MIDDNAQPDVTITIFKVPQKYGSSYKYRAHTVYKGEPYQSNLVVSRTEAVKQIFQFIGNGRGDPQT